MRDDPKGFLSAGGVPEWDEADADRFGRALDLLNEMIALLAARSRPGPGQETDPLHAEELRYAAERQRLSVTDRPEVIRILNDYPARLRQLQADHRRANGR
jgi:hypothetical protein